MLFTPKFYNKTSDKKVFFDTRTKLDLPDVYAKDYIENTAKSELFSSSGDVFCKEIKFVTGIDAKVKAEIEEKCAVVGNSEEYAITLGETTYIYANGEAGFIYGLVTIMQLNDNDELFESVTYDYPPSELRIYKIFLPGIETISYFKDVVDFLVYYKYNAMMIEIGGAMEYKRHPEINSYWVEYAKDMKRYSGRTLEIQHKTYYWHKNSIHCDNGEASYLSQDVCRELADYCRARGIDVIPECPTLSHCDYIVGAHPEIRERENDAYPDTYCPNHPDTYKIVFDILDEVIDVFKPKYINIAHDEYYSVGICDRCKDKDPVDIFVGDIEKINNYLNSKGVTAMMWGEKLLKAIGENGEHYGGWYDPYEKFGVKTCIPDLYPCATRMPKNMIFLHWYWIFQEELDNVFHENGYKVIFANFEAHTCKNLRKRMKQGIRGAVVSNWGSNKPEYMQRNRQYSDIVINAFALWDESFDFSNRGEFVDRAMAELFRRNYKGKENLIEITHTTDCMIPYHAFYDGEFIVDEVYNLGNYEITYSDGEKAYLPVKYGTNISYCDLGDNYYDRTLYYEVCYTTLQQRYGKDFYYKCKYENPHPEKNIASIRYVPNEDKKQYNVYFRNVLIPYKPIENTKSDTAAAYFDMDAV
jgi:hexosaminidase